MLSDFNLRKWTFKGRKIANPITITRKVIILPFLFGAVIIYCILLALFDFSIESGINAYTDNF